MKAIVRFGLTVVSVRFDMADSVGADGQSIPPTLWSLGAKCECYLRSSSECGAY